MLRKLIAEDFIDNRLNSDDDEKGEQKEVEEKEAAASEGGEYGSKSLLSYSSIVVMVIGLKAFNRAAMLFTLILLFIEPEEETFLSISNRCPAVM